MVVVFFTEKAYSIPFFTEDKLTYSFPFFTEKSYSVPFFTEDRKIYSFPFFTEKAFSVPFFTEDRDTDSYLNVCKYPTELEVIRDNAAILIHSTIKELLFSSINQEEYGRVSTSGFYKTGSLRVLLDYLSSIWIEKREDSLSGLSRSNTYYWEKYFINDIIINFRKCHINVKPIIDLFNIKTYEILDSNWNNYMIINEILNPPTIETTTTLKQWTDIFTNQVITLEDDSSKYSLSSAQTTFPLTKELKYLTSFTINGSENKAFIDHNSNEVDYIPNTLFEYTITNTDTVIITYWYEG